MNPELTADDALDAKRPTIVLLGEFSAGKSTLANVLLGAPQSTVRVTATQAPPVWYVPGPGAPVRIGTDGSETVLEGAALAEVGLEDTCAIRMPLKADILDRFTLIDMPGSSDPNMSPDIWDALLPLADMAIWCTPATQAWRQSEAAIWDMVPEGLHARSLLLLTRMDKVRDANDRARILARIKRETRGLFRAVLPVSLLSARKPIEACEASGMGRVMGALADIAAGAPLEEIAQAPQHSTPTPTPTPERPPTRGPQIIPVAFQPKRRVPARAFCGGLPNPGP